MERLWTEFGGVAGQVLRKSISGSSLVTGIVLGIVLLVGDWVLIMARAPEITIPFNQLVMALALARFALNGLYGEWNGTVFSGAGGPWSTVGLITIRYLALTAVWLVPMFFLVPRPEQAMAMGPGMGPNLSGSVVAGFLAYMLAMTLTPPLFLIVALSANSFADVFSPDHWRGQFSGRMSDVFTIYVVYTGTLGMVLVLAIAPVMLAFSASMEFGLFVGALVFCLLFGMSINLLGRICGFYVCGDLGLAETPRTPATPPNSPASPVKPVTDDFDSPLPATSGASAPAVPVSIPLVPSPATVSESVAQPTAAPPATRKPPLLDSKERVEAAVKRFTTDPAGAISALWDMSKDYAPHPHVMESLAVCLHRSGDIEAAIEMANKALPLCFERGHSYLAARIFREMRKQMARLSLDREQILLIAAALNKMGDLSGAAKAYSSVIETDAGEARAVKGLLQLAGRISAETTHAAAAVKVYGYLVERCPNSPLVEYMREGLEQAERKLAAAAPSA